MDQRSYKYVSLDVIAERVKDHPLLQDINMSNIIKHTVDVLRLVKAPDTYVTEGCYRNIVDYKVAIPDNALKIMTVDIVNDNGYTTPAKVSTDSLSKVRASLRDDRRDYGAGYTYAQNNSMIIFQEESVKNGIAFITYLTLKCSDEGYPMIPDDVDLIKAIEEYIKVQHFRVYYDLGKIGQGSLELAQQEYAWYIGKAQENFQGFANEDEMESFLSDFKRLFIIERSHRDRHRYNTDREIRYLGK